MNVIVILVRDKLFVTDLKSEKSSFRPITCPSHPLLIHAVSLHNVLVLCVTSIPTLQQSSVIERNIESRVRLIRLSCQVNTEVFNNAVVFYLNHMTVRTKGCILTSYPRDASNYFKTKSWALYIIDCSVQNNPFGGPNKSFSQKLHNANYTGNSTPQKLYKLNLH